MKTNRECLEQIDYYLYTRYITSTTLIAKENMHTLISHLSIKDEKGLNEILNKVLLLANQKDTLLTHNGLRKILIEKYPHILLDFIQTEKARKYIGY